MRAIALSIVVVASSAAIADDDLRLGAEMSAGHGELGNGHGDGLNTVAARVMATRPSGLTGQLVLAGLRVDDHSGFYTAATIGYRSSGRVWFHAGGGFGVVRYNRIDLLMGGTQTGDPREPTNWMPGLAFALSAGVDVMRRKDWQLYTSIGMDFLLSGPSLSASAITPVVGARW